MAVRVTEEQVRSIMTEVDGSLTDLTAFIASANIVVDSVCLDSGYTDAKLALIELWLAAHFVAVADPRRSSEGAGGISEGRQGQVALNLSVTMYGQQAMIIDTDGNLAALNKKVDGPAKATIQLQYWGTEDPDA
jgi:hypothetical protein